MDAAAAAHQSSSAHHGGTNRCGLFALVTHWNIAHPAVQRALSLTGCGCVCNVPGELYRVCPECCRRFHPRSGGACPDDGAPLLIVKEDGDDPLVGTVIAGKFTVTERLGRGGYGSVYRATQSLVEREVAVKVLKPEYHSNEEVIRRFFVEAKSISRLKNHHTVRLHDFGQTADGILYIAMELAEGEPLSGLMKRHVHLHPLRAARIGAQICESLAEAHLAGIIHRDLKPDNIMVHEQNHSPDFVKVLDFGIAKMDNSGDSFITATGVIQGTPAYMSPEQALGMELSHASDLYAVGLMVFTMLTGTPAFRRETAVATLMAQVHESTPDIHAYQPNVPQSLVDFVGQLLAKSPAERPSTADAVRQRLLHEAQRAQSVDMEGEALVLDLGAVFTTDRSVNTLTPAHTVPMVPASNTLRVDPVPWRAGVMAFGVSVAVAAVVLSLAFGQKQAVMPSGIVSGATLSAEPSSPEPPVVVHQAAATPVAVPTKRVLREAALPDGRPALEELARWSDVTPWTVVLRVSGTPGAAVRLGRQPLGSVPLTTTIPWSSTASTLFVTLAGHTPAAQPLTPNADQQIVLPLAKKKRRPAGAGSRDDLMPLSQ